MANFLFFGINSVGQLGIGEKDNQNKPFLLMNDNSISFLIGGDREDELVEWTHEKHILFSDCFKERILTFVLFLKRNLLKTKLKISKFILLRSLRNNLKFSFFLTK